MLGVSVCVFIPYYSIELPVHTQFPFFNLRHYSSHDGFPSLASIVVLYIKYGKHNCSLISKTIQSPSDNIVFTLAPKLETVFLSNTVCVIGLPLRSDHLSSVPWFAVSRIVPLNFRWHRTVTSAASLPICSSTSFLSIH